MSAVPPAVVGERSSNPLGVRWPDGTLARYGTHGHCLVWCDVPDDPQGLWAQWEQEAGSPSSLREPPPDPGPTPWGRAPDALLVQEGQGAWLYGLTQGDGDAARWERQRQVPVEDAVAVVPFAHGYAVFYEAFVRIERREHAPYWLAQPRAETVERFALRPTAVVGGAQWSGDAGRFATSLRLEVFEPYRFRGNLRLVFDAPAGVTIESASLDGTDGVLDEDIARWRTTSLGRGQVGTVRIAGRTAASARVEVRVVTQSLDKFPGLDWPTAENPHHIELGRCILDLTVDGGGLTLVRGEDRLAFESRWLADLERVGLLDRDTRAPDLDRWVNRALRRSRVETVADAPEAVLAEWLRMFEEAPTTESARGVPLFKLERGRYWVVTDAEAARIRDRLPSTNPLAVFATGAFTVEGPDPLAE